MKTKHAPQTIPLLSAIWGINRYAKRCRDAAASCYERDAFKFATMWKKRKEECYRQKGQLLAHLTADGTLQRTGYTQFAGGNWAEILRGNGYAYHRPIASEEVPQSVKEEQQGENSIEAKPKTTAEPRLCDAQFTIAEFLKDKQPLPVYQWQPRKRQRYYDWDYDEEDDYDNEDEGEYADDD